MEISQEDTLGPYSSLMIGASRPTEMRRDYILAVGGMDFWSSLLTQRGFRAFPRFIFTNVSRFNTRYSSSVF